MGEPAKKLDEKGRCCGRKPIVYKRAGKLFCHRCCADFSIETGVQIPSWAYDQLADGSFEKTPTGLAETN